MKTIKLTPLGYCHGVLRAIEIAKKAIKTEKKPIYILGSLIHNKYIVKFFEDLGCITLEEKGKTRLEMLDKIASGTVIFTAHGVSPTVYEKALNKGLTVIDASCKDVLKIHNSYISYLKNNYTCLYIGQKNHPEVEGVLGIDERIILIEKIDDFKDFKEPIYISNQTTLSDDDVIPLYEFAKNKYQNIFIDNERCKATTTRQNALKNNPTDLCYIIGDPKSSNSRKLFEVSSKYVKTIMIETVMDINVKDLKNVSSVSISAGASTPNDIIDDVYNYLLNLDLDKEETILNRHLPKIK